MSDVPSELKYTDSHEWVRLEADGKITVGITNHASELLGDMVFIELPEPETAVTAGSECAVVESVKAASDVYAPISGEIVSVNESLSEDPALVNQDPYGSGWLFVIQPEDDNDWHQLMDADNYSSLIESAE